MILTKEWENEVAWLFKYSNTWKVEKIKIKNLENVQNNKNVELK